MNSSSTKIVRSRYKPNNGHLTIILDIKKVRGLTILLGKLGLSTCRSRSTISISHYYPDHPEFTYGIGLKEAKDMMERIYLYVDDELIIDKTDPSTY